MSKEDKSATETNQSPAVFKEISLSQAILAPLDALFKAQVHAARSFLNLLLQIGYPHVELEEKGTTKEGAAENAEKGVYTQDFFFEDSEGKKTKVSIPALALVPITPLTIDNASFKLNFKVENTSSHSQMNELKIQKKDPSDTSAENVSKWNESNRPWYLVKDPVSFRGHVAPSQNATSETSDSSSSVINIEINLVRQPLPAGLDKLLTALQQSSTIKNL
jgi:hypothetical protein